MKQQQKKHRGLQEMRSRYAYTFVAHWILGLILFFVIPVVSSVVYSFSKVTIGAKGVQVSLQGIVHYRDILFKDANYLNNLRDSLGTIFYSLPIILALSLILAVILNQKFAGRTAARAIFFLPVIIATSAMMTLLNDPHICDPLFTVGSGVSNANGTGLIDFKSILVGWDVPSQFSNFISENLGNVFALIWNCGVQTILFLAGLQSIPLSLYEVSKIEGANKWEEFWFITVPMIRHVLTLVIIYTMIELFTDSGNSIMSQAFGLMSNKQIYDLSSAMLWFYFLIVIAVMGIVMTLYNKLCVKRWD